MVLRTWTSGLQTMTATTGTYTFENMTGHIKCIAIKPSGTSTDFRISTTKTGMTEYILGSAAAVSVLAAGKLFYPAVVRTDIDALALTGDKNVYTDIVLARQDVAVAVSNGADTETYTVEIIMEE